MATRDEVLEELLAGYKKPEDLLGPEGLLKKLTAALVGKALSAEMTEHLGYEKHEPAGRGSGNSRNGTSDKTLKTESGEMPITVPRDRNGTFEPQLFKKHQTHVDGFDEKIISLYARGMTVREIQGHLQELYGVDVSPDLVSRVTAAVIEEVKVWQSRPLEAVYPIVYLDALMIKVRDQGGARLESENTRRRFYFSWFSFGLMRRNICPMKHSDASASAIRRFASQHLGPASPMRRGSLAARLVKCSRPGCPCEDRPEARHGPYYSLTRPVDGKTHSRLIPQDQVEMVRRQIQAGREFRDALELHWNECERLADEQLEASVNGPGQGAEKGGSLRRSRRRLRERSGRS